MPKYFAGMNDPGYLPDNEPCQYDNFDDARRAVISELERDMDSFMFSGDDHVHVAEIRAAIAQIKKYKRAFTVTLKCTGLAYWVAREY
jgi:hypothetical protein